jgi:hypothetical protein
MRRVLAANLAVPAQLAVQLAAQLAPGTITAGNAEFSFRTYPTANTATAGTANFRVAGATSTDHLYHTWWWWRLHTDAREFALHNGTATQPAPVAVFAGRNATLTWPSVDSRNLRAQLALTLASAGAAGAVLVQRLTVTNNTGAPIRLNLFAYVDIDQCGFFANLATAVRANTQRITDPMCSTVGQVYAPGAHHHLVASFPAVRQRLLDTVADVLDDSGLPYGPGDYTSAFQWQDIVVPAAGSYSAYLLLAQDVPLTACSRVASASAYGNAKPGSNGLSTWNLDHLPFLGLPATLLIENGLAGSPPQLYLGTAPSSIYFPPFDVTLLIDLAQSSLSFFGATFDANNRSSTTFTLPSVAPLCGASLYVQGFYIDPGATRGVAHTPGLRWNLGSVF